MVGWWCLGQNTSRSHSFRKLEVKCSKFREVPLQPQLDHPGWPIEVSFERFTPRHLEEKVIKMGKKKWPCSYIVKWMQGLHQGNPLQFYSLGFVREDMLVEPVQEEVYVLLIPICCGRKGAKDVLGKWDETFEWGLIALEGWRIILQSDDRVGDVRGFSSRAR